MRLIRDLRATLAMGEGGRVRGPIEYRRRDAGQVRNRLRPATATVGRWAAGPRAAVL